MGGGNGVHWGGAIKGRLPVPESMEIFGQQTDSNEGGHRTQDAGWGAPSGVDNKA